MTNTPETIKKLYRSARQLIIIPIKSPHFTDLCSLYLFNMMFSREKAQKLKNPTHCFSKCLFVNDL